MDGYIVDDIPPNESVSPLAHSDESWQKSGPFIYSNHTAISRQLVLPKS